MKLSKMHIRVLKQRPAGGINLSADFTRLEEIVEGHYGRWGWEGPNKPDKGHRLGSCNVTRCQQPGAFWYNKGTLAYYCTSCAHGINYRVLPDGTYLCNVDVEAQEEFMGEANKDYDYAD